MERIDYRNWMAKQFQKHGMLPNARPDVVLFFLLKSFVPKEKNQDFGFRGFN